MKKYTFALFILSAIAFTGCLNNDFMERYPLGNPTEETAFVTYDNFKAYAWGLYETLPKLGYGDTSTDDISYNQTRGSSESNWIRDWSLCLIRGIIRLGIIMVLSVVSI